jgi:colicin import membrane protein
MQRSDFRNPAIEPNEKKANMMKTKIAMSLLMVGGALMFSAGCDKNDGTTPPAVKDSPTPASAANAQAAQAVEAQRQAEVAKAAAEAKAAEAAQAEAQKVQADAAAKLAAEKAATEKAAADKLAQTAAAAAQETARIQSLIDSATNLTGQNKYTEALKVLGELSNLKLTPEQQTLVEALTQTAQKQAVQAAADKAAADATKAVGNVLGDAK